MVKLTVVDKKYGCFSVKEKCSNCGRLIFEKSFSWDKDRISIGDSVEIRNRMASATIEQEYFYCPKCGHELTKSLEK